MESGNFSFSLTNTSLTGNGTDSLISIEQAELTGGEGDNILNAVSFTLGSVTLNGGKGNDYLSSGSSSDIIRGQEGDDIIDGNSGDDKISGGEGNDVIFGGDGNDVISGGTDNDVISAGDGNDVISGGGGNDIIAGGNGNDTIIESQNLFFILTDTDLTENGINSLVGIEQAQLTGDIRDNTLNASAFTLGSVTLNGGIGNDTMMGGTGNDIMRGEVGNDRLAGGDGNDAISGGDGNDRIRGEGGNDTIDGGNGTDTIIDIGDFSFTLTNTSLTGNGTDTLMRIEQAELTGGESDNTIDASAFTLGSVNLNGGDGNDALTGGNGNDSLVGGNGNDTLIAGTGSDRITFNSSNQGIDSITDFSVVDDTIAVSAGGFGGGLVANAAITAVQFVIGANATTATQRFIYNDTTGGLFFDVDGMGGTAQTQIATFSTGLLMTNNDIFVIS